MPSAALRWAGKAWMGWPRKRMLPAWMGNSPMMLRMRVVLPAPLRPITPAMLPSSRRRSTPRRICTVWMETSRPSIVSMACSLRRGPSAGDIELHVGIGQHLGRCAVGDHPAVVEGQDPGCITADDVHVVLHEQHRGAAAAHRPHDPVHDGELLLAADA